MIERNFITPDVLSDIEKLNKDCIRLHVPPPPVAFIECKVEPIDGGDPLLIHKEKANSFVRNYYNFLFHIMAFGVVTNDSTAGVGHLNRVRETGATRAFAAGSAAYLVSRDIIKGAAGSNAQGIVVGTSSSAESFGSYLLGAIIGHGTGTGQLAYSAGNVADATYDSGTKKWSCVHSRVFNNNSSGEIVVNETGIQCNAVVQSYAEQTLLERNVLSSPVAVPAGYKLTVTYTFEMTFPE